MPLFIVWALTALSWLYMRVFDRERWEKFKDRGEDTGGPLPPFSRLDTMVYGLSGLSILYIVMDVLYDNTERSAKTAENTEAMGNVIEKMSASSDQSLQVLAAMGASSDQSLQVLAAMREEADAARRETAKAQKLALWVGVGTAVVGAALGGVAGAFAADVLG